MATKKCGKIQLRWEKQWGGEIIKVKEVAIFPDWRMLT